MLPLDQDPAVHKFVAMLFARAGP